MCLDAATGSTDMSYLPLDVTSLDVGEIFRFRLLLVAEKCWKKAQQLKLNPVNVFKMVHTKENKTRST